jgi:RNA polymerase sigma-B factor
MTSPHRNPNDAPRNGSGSRIDQDRRLIERYHQTGDAKARDELVVRFMPLVRQLARRYQRGNEPLDDLVQVASIGLVKALDRFDASRGTAFSSYAVPTILGELKRYFRDSGWAVHVPRGIQERVLEVNKAVQRLSRDLSRSPTASEISEATGIETELVLEAMEAAVAYEAVSLDAPRSGDDGEASETYERRLGVDDGSYDMVEYEATLAPALRELDPRDRIVLHLRFKEDLTQSEIAERIGVSQMHVSRLIRRALAQLRERTDQG